LLALFPHADQKRWILWTPEGYYDASPGAEDLIGWHLNRGKDQAADFFPASRFRAVYYRPDVISRVLKTLDNTEALRQANAALGRPVASPESIQEVIARLSPPVVELAIGGVLGEVTVPKDARSVAVRYLVRQTGQEAPTKVSVRLNGRPVDVTAPLLPEGQEAAVEVPLPSGAEGEVSVIAEHRYGASEAAILRVRRDGGAIPAHKPDLYVIACGVAHLHANERRNANEDGFRDLHFAGDDARKFADLFGAQDGKAYGHVIPTVLVDKEATVPAITSALDEVQRKAQAGDVVVFFFSGHGHFTPESGYLLITHEAQAQNLATTALTGNELARRLASIRGSVVLVLDTCQAGAFGDDKKVPAVTGPGDLTGLVNQLSSSEQGVVVLSSSAEDQSSFEDAEYKQGLLTEAIAEGFTGSAAQNGQITCVSLQNWIVKRVPELVKRLESVRKLDPTAVQSPACILPKGVPDFTLAVQ
jgi:Caspase domain